ncbi:MAG: TonB-dependent receptor [Candidatus Krumholzibacteria bacterium]|jgi:iron complex outermembrane receptor protein|nr:TonB-dependent receptor [Candidatus Krumholzibacteria bacterium]MDP6797752.1 TonB-dependent receptor [Candidatus Krumholzibacteria bacterium]
MPRIPVFLLLLPALLFADIEGRVIDQESGEALPYATVVLEGSETGAISNAEGRFLIEGHDQGRILIHYLGYRSAEVSVSGDDLLVKLERVHLIEDPIVVTATRLLPHVDPLPFKNLDQASIAARYWAQDPPMLLAETPGVYAYNEAGNGIGNSYLTLRGFSQNRVSVLINGIPLNGSDSHEVWWVDLPDFASSLKDIQVQRGVMSGLYGSTALGGSINLLTDSFGREKSMSFSQGFGSWGTRKSALEYTSGVLDRALSFNVRLSKLDSQGYRDQSWTDSWAYYLNLSHFGENTTTRFNYYGGPENTHLAYKGISREQLENDRQANELDWEKEQDHFHQPHFELHHEWQLSPDRSTTNRFYLTLGEGYYEQMREGKSALEYNLVDTWAEDYDTDLIRRRRVEEYDAGWIHEFSGEEGRHEWSLGGELRLHDSHHTGDVPWALVYPAELPLYHRYYDYQVNKRSISGYLRDRYSLSAGLSLEAVLHLQNHQMDFGEDQRYGVRLDRGYQFFSPRLGLAWQKSESLSFFASASRGQREPSMSDIYYGADFWQGPDGKDYHFEENSDGSLHYIGPDVKPETVTDYEIGGRFSGEKIALDLTFYAMNFRDEIVPWAGSLDDNQLPNNGNAEQSLHSGVEFAGTLKLHRDWTFSLTGNWTRDRFVSYTEHYWTPDWTIESANYDGQIIPGSPVFNLLSRLEGKLFGAELFVSLRSVGRNYLDGKNLKERSVVPYQVVDAGLALPFEWAKYRGRLNCRVHNLLDREYETAGYIEFDDLEPRWFVGAPRNFYLGLELDL